MYNYTLYNRDLVVWFIEIKLMSEVPRGEFNSHEMEWRREEKVATRFNFISTRFGLRVGHRMTLDPRKAYFNIERSRMCSRSTN